MADSASEKEKALNGDWPMTWKRDVLDAEYRVGQTVIRETVKILSQIWPALTIEGLGWAC